MLHIDPVHISGPERSIVNIDALFGVSGYWPLSRQEDIASLQVRYVLCVVALLVSKMHI